MDVREPKRKRVGSHIKPQQPFPIVIDSENDSPFRNEMWPLFIGNFTGDSVVVCNPEEMVSLYTMGFFGKGSLSRGYPSFGSIKKGVPPLIKERQWKRRKLWMEKIKNNLSLSQVQDNSNKNDLQTNNKSSLSCNPPEQNKDASSEVTPMEVEENDSVPDASISVNEKHSNETGLLSDNVDKDIDQLKESLSKYSESSEVDVNCQVLVINDSDDEDLEKVIRNPQPHLEYEPIKTVVETLCLTLEEAFFLSYALGCLHVIDLSGNTMDFKQMWISFCKFKPNFIELYVAYHYFRAKGWVVKSGWKFGGDFLLYKQGPPFYHASYIVLVEKVNSRLEKPKNSPTWTKLHGLNRLAENSGKDIIMCQVLSPDSLTSDDLLTPKSLHKFQVNELLTKRWISSQEREEKDNN